MVISGVARAGQAANHHFLGREGRASSKDSRGWMHTRLLINTPDTHYEKKQAEPQLTTNCKPSGWRGERQGPPTPRLAEDVNSGDAFTATRLLQAATQPSAGHGFSTTHRLLPWPPPCVLTKRDHGLFFAGDVLSPEPCQRAKPEGRSHLARAGLEGLVQQGWWDGVPQERELSSRL